MYVALTFRKQEGPLDFQKVASCSPASCEETCVPPRILRSGGGGGFPVTLLGGAGVYACAAALISRR
jgi:hypothetical protein